MAGCALDKNGTLISHGDLIMADVFWELDSPKEKISVGFVEEVNGTIVSFRDFLTDEEFRIDSSKIEKASQEKSLIILKEILKLMNSNDDAEFCADLLFKTKTIITYLEENVVKKDTKIFKEIRLVALSIKESFIDKLDKGLGEIDLSKHRESLVYKL